MMQTMKAEKAIPKGRGPSLLPVRTGVQRNTKMYMHASTMLCMAPNSNTRLSFTIYLYPSCSNRAKVYSFWWHTQSIVWHLNIPCRPQSSLPFGHRNFHPRWRWRRGGSLRSMLPTQGRGQWDHKTTLLSQCLPQFRPRWLRDRCRMLTLRTCPEATQSATFSLQRVLWCTKTRKH